ncbi:MAG: RIP metalloprotease RseP [Xanthomonadaceae bacterium]|nr:RIP metalloprotease RseP [Xanthomonadaceae bacterium]
MLSILGFLVVLAPLVIVHELGHFLFAKLFKVKAEVFSIGFGPRLFSKQWGETEFRVAVIPLGGFVKLLGEEPGVELSETDKHRALQHQAAWKRFLIFFGGPLFNFLWAGFVFMLILLIGEPQISNQVSRIIQNSAASKIGLKSGDRILAIDDKAITKLDEFMQIISEKPGEKTTLKVQHLHSDLPVLINVVPETQSGYSSYGETKMLGHIDGIYPYARGLKIGVSNPKSVAGIAGIKTGYEAMELNGVQLSTWEQLETVYQRLIPGKKIKFQYKDEIGQIKSTDFVVPSTPRSPGEDLGLFASELFVDKPVEKAPAILAGIRSGDRMVSIDGVKVYGFGSLKEQIQKAGETRGKVKVSWEREGKMMEADIVPQTTRDRDPALNKIITHTIGIIPHLSYVEPDMVIERILNPFMLTYKGFERMVIFTYRNFVSIGKIFSGDVSVSTLGGPILIGKLAGDSLSRGLVAFLTTMAILSVGLGVLNILPVPVLDGGHLVLLGLEMIRGKALTIRQMEIVQQVGLSLILLLMVVVMKNDISRLAIFR